MIDSKNVEKRIFVEYNKELRSRMENLMVEMKFSNSLQNAKKLNEKALKDNIVKINSILNREESQKYLITVLNGGEINMIPKTYELHQSKKLKVLPQKSRIEFNEGSSMINNGESCFIIVSLQLLFHLEFYVFQLSEYEKTPETNKNIIETTLLETFCKSQDMNEIRIDEIEILIKKYTPNKFVGNDQKIIHSDCPEFLKFLHTMIDNRLKDLFVVDSNKINEDNLFIQLDVVDILRNGNDLTKDLDQYLSHRAKDTLKPIILLKLNRMIGSKKKMDFSEIDIPDLISIASKKYELKSIICYLGNLFISIL